MARRRNKSEDEETTYWLSYSDMMAALLLIFVLIISFTMLQAKQQYEMEQQKLEEQEAELMQKEAEIEAIQAQFDEQQLQIDSQTELLETHQNQLETVFGIKSEMIEALQVEFSDVDIEVNIDPQTGAILLDSDILFDLHQSYLTTDGKAFLEEFFPRYLSVLTDDRFKDYVAEVIIEGHTDPSGMYIESLTLSQERAFEVTKYCLNDKSTMFQGDELEFVRSLITVNGRSYFDPIYKPNGRIDYDQTRRVEIKFRLKDEEMIQEMMELLKEN